MPRDDKLLASWNGLALQALVLAAQHDRRYADRARTLRDFIVGRLWDGQSLRRALADGQYLGDATLEDYAYVAAGLLDWARFTARDADIALVSKIVQQAWKRFYSDQGWLLSEDMIAGISAREASVADGPMPSPSASLIRVTLELAHINKDKQLLAQASVALNRGHRILATDNFWYATHLLAMAEALKVGAGLQQANKAK